MGLLSRINNMNQHKSGLLARADMLKQGPDSRPSDIYSFSDFTRETGVSIAGIFCREGDYYYLTECTGFDLSSIANSFSTNDFWNGIIAKDDDWNIYEGDELNQILQFFSKKLRDDIKSVAVLPFTQNSKLNYFLTTDKDKISLSKDELIKKLSDIKAINNLDFDYSSYKDFSTTPARLFIISSKLSFDKEFSSFGDDIKCRLADTALKQLDQYCKKLFVYPNCCCAGTNGEIKAVMFSKDLVDDKLLEAQLNSSLSSYYSDINDSNVLVLQAGTCNNPEGIKAFLSQN